MAITQANIYVAPSVDSRTLEQLNDVELEAGLYVLNAEYTINEVTATKWTILSMSSEIKDTLHCYSQIWIPITTTASNMRMFMRNSVVDSTNFTNFTELLTEDALQKRAVINKDTDKVELVLGGIQPTPEEGTKVLWVA